MVEALKLFDFWYYSVLNISWRFHEYFPDIYGVICHLPQKSVKYVEEKCFRSLLMKTRYFPRKSQHSIKSDDVRKILWCRNFLTCAIHFFNKFHNNTIYGMREKYSMVLLSLHAEWGLRSPCKIVLKTTLRPMSNKTL